MSTDAAGRWPRQHSVVTALREFAWLSLDLLIEPGENINIFPMLFTQEPRVQDQSALKQPLKPSEWC